MTNCIHAMLEDYRLAVLAITSEGNQPEAALIRFVVTNELAASDLFEY